jgi:threonine synthase
MGALKQAGAFSIAAPALAAIRRDFDAVRVDEKACADEMGRVYRDSGVIVDPHSAVGVHAARAALARDPATPVVALATAHAAKFPEAVERAIGRRPAPPPRLAELQSRRERYAILPNDPAAVAKFVRERARVAA